MNSKDLAMLNRLKKIASGGGSGGQVDTSYVDAQDAKTLSEAKSYTDNAVASKANTSDLTSHTGNTTVHITSSERTKWNSKAEGDHTHDQYLTEHQDISGKANVSDLNSHTGNKSNPHGVTKDQIGLSNVENKSSATIRGELTKENVTDALGYVPPMTSGGTATTESATLTTSGWTSSGDTYTQTVNVPGVTATSILIVSPDVSTGSSYSEFGVMGVGQGSGTVTFLAYILPTVNLLVNILNLGEES